MLGLQIWGGDLKKLNIDCEKSLETLRRWVSSKWSYRKAFVVKAGERIEDQPTENVIRGSIMGWGVETVAT